MTPVSSIRRTSRTVKSARGTSTERRAYDAHGRLAAITEFGKTVKFFYDAKGRIARQMVDGSPIDFAYTKYGQLAGKYLGGKEKPDAAVEYEYSKSGQIVARTANGVRQTYEYDGRGQLLAVKEGDTDVERYAYDKAGNMLKKSVRGKTTTFAFDGANQLVSSTCDGVTTEYAYDAAGRLVKEGDKTYTYGYLDKVLSVTEGAKTYSYDYHVDGQLARADYGNGKAEDFGWDGLALIRRGDERFVNEPHIGGGNPVASSKGTKYFNDMLGTTVGAKFGKYGKYTAAALTAFGEDLTHHCPPPSTSSTLFYTGKPHVAGLGHAFLMRNYRAGLGKWQTADPLGYPDGWNQLAYCGNGVAHRVDIFGTVWGNLDFLSYYFRQDPSRTDPIDTDVMGLTGAILGNIEAQVYPSFAEYIDARAKSYITSAESGRFSFPVGISYGVACEDICFSLGGGSVRFTVTVTGYWDTYLENGCEYVYYMWQADGTCKYSDEFRDAVDVFNLIKKDTYIDLGAFFIGVVGGAGVGITIPENWEFPYGRPYGYSHVWDYSQWRDGVIKRLE